MHLGYLDDSDTKQRGKKLQVMSGVLIEDKQFKLIEISMNIVRRDLLPEEKLEHFTEFHACELYGGYGVFEGIEQEKRFEAIKKLLALLRVAELSVVYGAVDIAKAEKEVCGSAEPLDISFRICFQEIYQWIKDRALKFDIVKDEEKALAAWFQAIMILIVDDCEKKHRDMLQTSFRKLRHPAYSPSDDKHKTHYPHFHDDIFFGDSRYSVGIQLADICSYFIARHLMGDEEIKSFYEMIEPYIVFGQLYPQESTFRVPQPLLTLNSLSRLIGDAEPGVQEVRPDDA